MKTQTMHDQEILTDMLTDQKQTTGMFNQFAGECMCMNLKGDMLSILQDEQSIQDTVFQQMHSRGWYEPKPAEAKMVTETRTKFEGIAQML